MLMPKASVSIICRRIGTMNNAIIIGVIITAALFGSGCAVTTHFRHPRTISVLRNDTDTSVVQRLDSLLREKAWFVQRSETEFLCHKNVDYALGDLLLTLQIELTESELLITYFGVYKVFWPLSYAGDIEYQALGVMHRGTFGNRERLYFDEDHCTEAVCSMIRSATNGVRAINGVDKREWD